MAGAEANEPAARSTAGAHGHRLRNERGSYSVPLVFEGANGLSKPTLEIFEDHNSAGEGRILILLGGVAELPEDPAYAIAPLSTDEPESSLAEWPLGLRAPEEIRLTEAGMELVIGRDMADRLAPGVRVAIEIPSLDLREELEWPSMGCAQPAPNADHALSAHEENKLDGIEQPPDPVSLQEAQEQLSTIVAKILKIETADGAAAHHAPDDFSLFRSAPASQHVGPPELPGGEFPARNDDQLLDRPRILNTGLRRPHLASERSRKTYEEDLIEPAAGEQPEYAAGSYPTKPPSVDRVSRRMSFIAVGLAAAAAFFVFGGALFGMKPQGVIATGLVPAQAPTERVTRAKGLLSDVLSVPLASPSGKTRKDIDLDRALTLADQHLQGSGAADRSESEYWLRHALSIALGDERIKWALTQLGSAYAGGSAAAVDYEKARLLWEMAGQLGDPVALCFLGALYEYGLGVSADKASALAWYARAKQAGGCPAIDEALTRVTQ